jgi:hypothetical protein
MQLLWTRKSIGILFHIKQIKPKKLISPRLWERKECPTGLVIFVREPISKSAITGLSVRRPVRRAGTSPVESLRHRGGMRDEPFVPFTELEFFRDVSLVFGLELDY